MSQPSSPQLSSSEQPHATTLGRLIFNTPAAPPSTIPQHAILAADSAASEFLASGSRLSPQYSPVNPNATSPALSASYITAAAPATPTSSRPVRKAKAHVASACINCKKAHLSCDIERPCRRCRDTGKMDTCRDVQHKKRGRPRLREDTESDIASSSQQTSFNQTIPRPMASTRTRRAASFRSHQSHGSEGSSFGQITPISQQMPPWQVRAQYPVTHPNELPIAILDLDLHILSTNDTFTRIFETHASSSESHIGELINTAEDAESFPNLRNRIRRERELREPSHLPPIREHGHHPLHGIQDDDLRRWTQGNPLLVHRWMSRAATLTSIPITVNIWLAKASMYFVIVTVSPVLLQHYIPGYSPGMPSDLSLLFPSRRTTQGMVTPAEERGVAGLAETSSTIFYSPLLPSPIAQSNEGFMNMPAQESVAQNPVHPQHHADRLATSITQASEQLQPHSQTPTLAPLYPPSDQPSQSRPASVQLTAPVLGTAIVHSSPTLAFSEVGTTPPAGDDATISGSGAPSAKRRRRIDIDDVLD